MIGYGNVASTVDVRAALESMECVDPLGERTVGAGSDMDSTFDVMPRLSPAGWPQPGDLREARTQSGLGHQGHPR